MHLSTHHASTTGFLLSLLPVFVKSPLVRTFVTAHLAGVPAVAGMMSGCGRVHWEGGSHCPQPVHSLVDQ